jgi:heme-degrading monooxygenase HmoA
MMITQTSGLATMINVFDVEPEKQQQLIEIWLEEGKKFETWPGFVSTTLHRSLDGTRVINYAQWQKAEDWLNLAKQGGQLFSRFKGIAVSDPHLYEVIYLSTATEASHVTIEQATSLATMINVFTVEPENQQQLIETWLEEGKKFELIPGFISATLHRSTDGTRVINYAQWQKAEDWLDISRRAGQLFGNFREISKSDPHLYEVIYLSTIPQQQ